VDILNRYHYLFYFAGRETRRMTMMSEEQADTATTWDDFSVPPQPPPPKRSRGKSRRSKQKKLIRLKQQQQQKRRRKEQILAIQNTLSVVVSFCHDIIETGCQNSANCSIGNLCTDINDECNSDEFILCRNDSKDNFDDTTTFMNARAVNKKQLRKAVTFDTVTIRTYDVTLGDHPSCSRGLPVSLDWSYEQRPPTSIDVFEYSRAPERRTKYMELLLSSQKRKAILQKWGITPEEMNICRRQLRRVQWQRRKTRFVLWTRQIQFLPSKANAETLPLKTKIRLF